MQSEWRRIGSRRSARVFQHWSWLLREHLGGLQQEWRVAAGEDEIADARRAEICFLLASAPCQIDMSCAGVLKGFGGHCRPFGIDLVGRAKAGEPRAGRLERFRKRCAIGKSFGRDGLYPAGFEETPGEACPRRKVGRRTKIGKENPWPRASGFEYFVRAVAQAFEGRRKPHRD